MTDNPDRPATVPPIEHLAQLLGVEQQLVDTGWTDDGAAFIASHREHPSVSRFLHRVGATPSPRHPRQRPIRAGFVYLIKMGDYYKIGRTKDWSNRKQAYGLHLPLPYEEIVIFPTNDMHAHERQLHQAFQDKRMNGEWFRLTEDDVAQIERFAQAVRP
jgi:hypothetical protein